MTFDSNNSKMNSWRLFFSDKIDFVTFSLLALTTYVFMVVNSSFLLYAELREGYVLDDYILNKIPAINVSILLFSITYTAVVLGLGAAFRTPYTGQWVMMSCITITILRMLTMYMLPLEPPANIIPLRDPFLESTFYGGDVLTKDLFFSGHTSSVLCLALIVVNKRLKYYLFGSTACIGILLLLQHAHYTIDIIAAIPATIAGVYLGKYFLNQLYTLQWSFRELLSSYLIIRGRK